MESDAGVAVIQDSKNVATLTWVGTLFFGFIPSLMIYLIKKDDLYIHEHAKEALNWSITVILGYLASLVLSFVLIGILGFMILGICHIAFCIMGAVAASNGKAFRALFAMRLIK